jgi:acetyl esterase/lipase
MLVALAAASPASTTMGPAQPPAISAQAENARLTYGTDPHQFGELRIPKGKGPHPVVVVVHGGCFRGDFAGLEYMSPLAEALTAEGVATWNIEYRRLGDPGGGWPGTYQDVGRAIDYVRELAPRYELDLRRVVVVGHSAGGHLALWSASRAKLPPDGPISAAMPLKLLGVVNLAGLPDLRENVGRYEELCRGPVLHQMLGGDPATQPDRARAGAAAERLPLGAPQVVVLGDHEDFVPRPIAMAYVAKARAAGDNARLVVIPDTEHFDLVSTTTSAWPRVRAVILELLNAPH